MRKPRDIDSELKALHERQKQLRARRTLQLGELVVATGADALSAEILAGALIEVVTKAHDIATTEAWQQAGAGFFRRDRRARGQAPDATSTGTDTHDGSPASDPGGNPAQ